MKIDIYAHWWPREAAQMLLDKARPGTDTKALEYLVNRERRTAVNDLELRFRFMDRHPDVFHVLSISNPPVELFVDGKEAAEISRTANDELAELVANNPDRFVGAVAILPMNDMQLALEEADRVLGKLGMVGVRLYTNILGDSLASPKLFPLYEKMVEHDRPIWIHPTEPATQSVGSDLLLGWEYETSKAMLAIADSDVFERFPEIKFLTHHLGAMIPFFEHRIKWLHPNRKVHGNLKKFYNDTALYGGTSAMQCGFDFFGVDRVLFGTDMPLGSKFTPNSAGFVEQTIRAIEGMMISNADKQRIFSDNALELLRLAV
jgi:predicted TIM-barrel fold metal-dependent hydrolase